MGLCTGVTLESSEEAGKILYINDHVDSYALKYMTYCNACALECCSVMRKSPSGLCASTQPKVSRDLGHYHILNLTIYHLRIDKKYQ